MESTGTWVWSISHRQPARVEERFNLWGDEAVRLWLPQDDTLVRVRASEVRPLEASDLGHVERVKFTLCATRLANLAFEDVLLAPSDSAVIPLPHQIRALRRAVSGDRVRYLLADEVGLGKTIEAGLIIRELKLRGRVRRVLVIAPKGLVKQWQSEMKIHFGEELRHLAPAEFDTLRKVVPGDNVWRACDQVICSLDSVKPLDTRRGWTAEELAAYNKDRFDDLIAAGWDLIVIDEAHRLGGSTEQVARHQLGLGLAEAAPYLLLLSATPHQGKTDAFHRLLTLLDKKAFPAVESVTRERVLPYVIRTEKRQAVTADGLPLFKPRFTQLRPVEWGTHTDQEQLYEAVTSYVRHGYNQALRDKKPYVGFLMILMQRLVTSSTRAIRTALEKRLAALTESADDANLPKLVNASGGISMPASYPEDEWSDLNGQEQLDIVFTALREGMANERGEIESLLRLARQVEGTGVDSKAEALFVLVRDLERAESDPDLKVLIFTEFVPTQDMLAAYFASRAISSVSLNGSMSMEERQQVQAAFAKDARVLISTDAGGEGLNLQFCHIVINFDIPWNPMRMEQRIGRVDRIGQKHLVRAFNFVFADTVEFRVREVLEEKLAVILADFGVDKTSDVLDSAEAGKLFDRLYLEALLHPDRVDEAVGRVSEEIKQQAGNAQEKNRVLVANEAFQPDTAPKLPIADWVERMVGHYLAGYEGHLDAELNQVRIRWPDAETPECYTLPGREPVPGAQLLSLEHPRVRAMLSRLPRVAEGAPVPTVKLADAPAGLSGVWSLWEVRMTSEGASRARLSPLFVHSDGRNLAPTAKYLFERLMMDHWTCTGLLPPAESTEAYTRQESAARDNLKEIYLDLKRRHLAQVQQEEEKGEYSYRVRAKILGEIGLPEVRQFRLRQLENERQTWRSNLVRQRELLPELQPLLMFEISTP
jgi:superfamily II DNA or RNA helicase